MTNTTAPSFTRTYLSPRSRFQMSGSDLLPDGSMWLSAGSACERYVIKHRVIVNVDVLQAALDQVTNVPYAWNQREWFSKLSPAVENIAAAPECGTAACLAGTIALQHGAQHDGYCVRVEGHSVRTNKFAEALLLQVLESQAADSSSLLGALWAGDNSLADLWTFGQVLTADRLTVPSLAVINAAQAASDAFYTLVR